MTSLDRFRTVLWMVGLFVLSGCSPTTSPPPLTEGTGLPQATEPVLTSPPEESTIEMTPTLPTSPELKVQSLIERTKEDLGNRLAIAADTISLVEITEVEWSDSSLDCPQPGMEYLQVITPGYRILLQADHQVYEYHSNSDIYFVYCENQFPPTATKS